MDKDTKLVLEELEMAGMATGKNISPLLQGIFGDLPNNKEQIEHEANRIIDFLKRLESPGLIKISGSPQGALGNLTDSGRQWFPDTTIWAYINLDGLNWLNQQRQQLAEENLRKSIIDTNLFTKVSLGITTFITGLIIVIQVETNSRERRKEKREIAKEQQTTQELQNRTQSEIRFQTLFVQLNQALLRLDTSVKKVKIAK